MIGEQRVKEVSEEIIRRAEEISAECLKPDKTTGWISSPILKDEKKKNQTCNLMIKGKIYAHSGVL